MKIIGTILYCILDSKFKQCKKHHHIKYHSLIRSDTLHDIQHQNHKEQRMSNSYLIITVFSI